MSEQMSNSPNSSNMASSQVPLLHVNYAQTGQSTKLNEMGMREMQAKAFAKRDAQYLLLKAPPASGKSRALMFLALDKLHHQGIRKAIIAVPEMSIGGSFQNTDLVSHGFFANWNVEDRNNLCVDEGLDSQDKGKVGAFIRFMQSTDEQTLICTHATLRFAVEELINQHKLNLFNNVLVAIDEFHHVSADADNRLGTLIDSLMKQTSAHIVAMTGSYFRGDAKPILLEEDEALFEKVTYTYYEQLNGYTHLKSLGLNYHFYQGDYVQALPEVLDSNKKTIVHIPSVQSGEAAFDKYSAVGFIIDALGTEYAYDPETCIRTIKTHDGRLIKFADLVDDNPEKRPKVQTYLRNIKNPEEMDVIVALGMAKEGFDWPFCEHVLTIGYRSSMTEVVQIIGRSTRDAPGKTHAQFTNLIAYPDANNEDIKVSVNNLIKAITLSLLMEQVLAPNIKFRRRSDLKANEKVEPGTVIVDDKAAPVSDRVLDILNNEKDEIVAALANDDRASKTYLAASANAQGNLQDSASAETANMVYLPQIIARRYPDLNQDEQEQLQQGILTAMMITKQGGLIEQKDLPADAEIEQERKFVRQGEFFVNIEQLPMEERQNLAPEDIVREREMREDAMVKDIESGQSIPMGNTRFIRLGKKFINIENLNIDLIREVNLFDEAYEVLSKNIDAGLLKTIQTHVQAGRIQMSDEEALMLWGQIQAFVKQHQRSPNVESSDPREVRMAEAIIYLRHQKAIRKAQEAQQAQTE